MAKIAQIKYPAIWKDVVSPMLFMVDVIDSFKYRTKQAWFALISAIAIFAALFCVLPYKPSPNDSSFNLIVSYSPLIITLVFWFRACSIYNFKNWDVRRNKPITTKKSIRASFIFKITWAVLGMYYLYCVIYNLL